MRSRIVLMIAACAISRPSLPASQDTYEVAATKNITYYRGEGYNPQKHSLDVYRPSGLNDTPVLLFVHGGAWTGGDKSLYEYIGERFARRGITTVVPSYRLTPEVMHPGHVKDVARAFAWTYQNIGLYGGDPKKIFITGHSAGGHLSALLALDDSYLSAEGLSTDLIRAAMPISGVYNLNLTLGFDSVFTNDPAKRAAASPVSHTAGNRIPFMTFYGELDIPTLDFQAGDLHSRLERDGSFSILFPIPGKNHLTIISTAGTDGEPVTEVLIRLMELLLQTAPEVPVP